MSRARSELPQFMPTKSFKCDIGIVTVIPEELEWVRRALGIRAESRLKVRSGLVYYFGDLSTPFASRPYRVALVCIGEGGTAECASTTTALIHKCRPRLVMLVGIAAGVRKSVSIGSVIMSERVWGYEKEVLSTGRKARLNRVPRPSVHPLPFRIQQDVNHYFSVPGRAERIETRFREIRGVYPRPSNKSANRDSIVNSPEMFFATVASGNKLLRHPGLLYRLQNMGHGRIKIGEMEADGLAIACHREAVDWLVIRGISDFGDKFKSDRYHNFAAQMAAVATRDFIERGLQLSVRSPRPIRRVAVLPLLSTIDEAREVMAKLPSANPSQPGGPVAAKIIELSKPFAGKVYRAFSATRPALEAAPFPSRFSSRGGFLYFLFSEEDSLGEIEVQLDKAGISPKRLGITVAQITARLSFVLDVTDKTVQQTLSINADALSSGDPTYARSIADAARLAGCEGLLVKSSQQKRMLVIFDKLSLKSDLSLLGPRR